MDLEIAQTTTTAKLPILKQGEYDMWRLRIEQYFQVQDYAIWDVIENGNSFKPVPQTNADGSSTSLIPGLYKNFRAPSTESLDSIFNRLQKIVSQLAILGENISQEDLNLNFLRSLPSEWNTHVVVWRNKPDLDIMSFDDLYKIQMLNKRKLVERSLSLGVTQLDMTSLKWSVSTAVDEHFVYKECRRDIGSNVSRNRNQDSSRRTVNVEETSFKARWAIVGVPEFEGYGPKTSKSVSEDISNEVRESPDAPLVEELVLDDKLEKKTVFPTVAKIEFVRSKQQENSLYKIVKYAKMYRSQRLRENQRNWKNQKSQQLGSDFGHPQKEDQGYVDSGCSRHMTGNMSYLSDFKEFDGGYVTFGGGAKGGKITGKGTLKTGKLDFEDVYFVKELQFNLFSVSQMCDKKNSVLFTDTGCFVLSPDFKLADESQVLLKVPRKNNMYSVDMKNIVPKESLTCLVAKATLDESMLWHRRLGHVNFKTINKLVKENLVRGLPSKHFENDQTCVACLKENQHKTSCKSKIQNSITQPLFMLHMDLFGPTFMSSLMNKKYCLVVTDDYSRFTWVFFLTTKDETSGILKSFITEIENLVDKKVKIFRCDNGTKFKNRVMSEFCKEKGVKKEFSATRTPQQNSVAERRNRTLIEAARTMLADSKLPTTFWSEAVNTACYVQNRVLVVKPYNKTTYELFRGRTHALSFMRPFGRHNTIINTLDYLGKFDGKSNEGFFVGYSMNSDGPKWLFDIDVLTKSMNYVPVVAGTNSNDLVGTEASNGVGHSSKKTGSSQDYILMPLWKDGSLFDSSLKNASNDEPQPFSDAGKKDDKGINKESGIDD
ncbi:putative ribonuclease H-like domain-containing protein [Tanacetum coccineum]|uniref:Ribonuclease H-like domain-containing protein n=1 Tax=Tanacetum coccineum TaxID=301880 RepID=A0ABQ4XE24_9ASTR